MGKRRPDPRVTTHATPPLVTVKGETGKAKLRLACLLEHCDNCDNPPIFTHTEPGTGLIKRRCMEHLTPPEDVIDIDAIIAMLALDNNEKRVQSTFDYKPDYSPPDLPSGAHPGIKRINRDSAGNIVW